MRWDAYNCTIPERPETIVQGLRETFHGIVHTIEEGRGRNSYAVSTTLRDFLGTSIASVLSGGRNPAPHVQCQGVYSADLAASVRTRWPMHTVSRADSAMDFDEPGLFDKLADRFGVFANNKNLKWDTRGEWGRPAELADPMSGRTFYVGARESLGFLRVYEKGKHIMQEVRDGDEIPSIHWVRVELEVKPQDREQKARLARLSPEAVWGVSHWTRAACRMVCGLAVERVMMWQPSEPDAYRACRHMAAQYRQSIETVAQQEGGIEGFMKFLQEAWEQQDRTRFRAAQKAAA